MAVSADLKKLDEYLLSPSYITGIAASQVLTALAKPPPLAFVNVMRWYIHIDALLRISGVSGDGCGVTVKGDAPVRLTVADTKASLASPFLSAYIFSCLLATTLFDRISHCELFS